MALRKPIPPVRRGLWIPVLFGLLVVLTIPGVVLLALSLFGLENATNGWLRRTFGLSYHNPLPTWAAIALFFVPVILVILYFLKLRRKSLEVPTTFLWRKSIEDLHVNSLFQWLRDNLLLLVQLCVVLLLIYSALAFQVHGRSSVSGKYYILLIDSSASMGVNDVAPSRLEMARAEALKEIDSRPEGDTGMVIEFNSRATILAPYTRDKGLLRAAVRQITQTQRPTRIEQALIMADGLANPTTSADDQSVRPAGENPAEARTYVAPEGIAAEVHLFSDGRFEDVPNFAAGNLSLKYHRIGASGADQVNNVGIVNLNAIRDEKEPSKLQVFVRLLNFRKLAGEVTVTLDWRISGKEEFSSREKTLRLPGRYVEAASEENQQPTKDNPGEGAVTFDLSDIDDTSDVILHAKLKNHRDQFPLDDEVWLVAGVVRKARVLIVSPGNDVLRNFFDLEETSKLATVAWLTPRDLTDNAKYLRPVKSGEFDLVIFDRCAPANEQAMPDANTFFIASVPPPFKRADMPPLKNAIIRNPASSHPLMRHLTGLDEIAFADAFRFDLRADGVPAKTPRLLEADRETAVMFVLTRGTYQDLTMTFPLVNDKGEWATNWPLKLSFPVFLQNVLYQLGGVSDSAAEESLQPGTIKVIRPEQAVTRIEVSDPAKLSRPLAKGPRGEFVVSQTEKTGIYQATWSGGGRVFAVNLLDAEESNTQPRDEIKIGEQKIEADMERLQTYDLWKWMALVALVLLVLEWAVFHRKV